MSSNSPDAVLYDKDGNALSVQNGVAIPASTPALMVAGSDGANSRYITIDSSGHPIVVGAGTAGSPSGGVISIQGVASGTVVPISGTVTANAGTGNFAVVQATASNLLASVGGLGASGAAIVGNPVRIGGSDGTNTRDISTDSSGRVIVIGAAASGAAVAGNPVLIAGSDGSNARSIRTATDGTVRIDPTGTTTQPVSGTVAATQSGTWTVQPGNTANTTPWLITINQGGNSATVTASNALKVDGSAVTQPVSGTVTANIGTTNGLALDATLAKLTIAQGASLGTNTQALMGGSVTTAAPTYTTGQISPLSLTTAGAIRIDGSGVTQPVSGTVTSNIGTTNGLALDASVNGILLSQGSTTSGQKGPLIQGAVTTSAPTYTTGQTDPLSLTTAGALRIDGSATTQPVSGTVTSNQGTANSLANAWSIKITDTTNGPAAVKAASTAAVATDPALVVAVSPNNSVVVTQATAANLNATVVQSTAANLRAQTAGEATTATSTGTIAELVGGAVTTAAPTYTTGQMNPLSLDTSGNLRVTGTFTSSGTADTTASGNLNALNAAVQIALAGQSNSGMQLAAGTLVGTIVPEISIDGGTTWVSTFFDDPVTGNKVSSIVFGSSNTATTRTIVGTGGASHARIRVSAYTSGTATCNLRASTTEDPSLTSEGAAGSALAPTIVQIGGSVTTSAPSYSNATMNALSLDTSGNLRVSSSAAADTTATGSLNVLNAAVQVALTGQQGAAMQLLAGTLIGTIVPELSVDGGTTWISTYFDDPTNSAVVSSFVFGSNNTAKTQTIIVTGGASHVRVRVSLFTSGTATCNLRASFANDPALTWIGPTNSTAPPAAAMIGGKDASGKLQVPQVDVILGQTVEQISVASTLTSPGAAARGVFAYTNAYGSLRVSPESTTVFTDIFDGTIIDPVKWTTTGTVSQASGLMTVNAGTAASGSAILQGNITNVNLGLEFEIWGCTAAFVGPATGTYRFIGVGTQSGGAATDAIGFEYDSTGTLFAVIYAGGSNVFRSSALSPSPGTSFNRYGFHFRSDLALFYYQTSEYPCASSSFITPNVQTLAPLFFVKNGGSTLGSNAIINLQGVGTTDTGRNASQISDGKYPHRRGEVDAGGRLYVRPGFDTLLAFDAIEGSTLNSWLWKTAATGMTVSVSTGSIILTGNTTSGNNINLQTNVQYPFSVGGSVKGTWRVAMLTFTNTFVDFGFGGPSGTSNLTGDSAYFKLDSNGNLDGYFYSGGSLSSTGNITGIITSGNYFDYSIEISDRQARFKIESSTQKLFDMTLASVSNQPRSFTVTHLPAFIRQANSGVPALGGTVDVGAFEVHLLDINTTKKWEYQMASAGRSASISPTTFAQTAQLAAGAAPTAGTPSNTAALYTTLGGEYICNATATSENLLSIFAFTIPSPYTFYLTGMFIPPPIVNNAAVATTGTILEFFCIVNCASTNINTGGGQRFTVPGFFSVAVSAAVGTVFNGVAGQWTPTTPIACQPNTVIHIGYKVVLGTATASNRQRGSVYVDGFFE